MGTPSKGLFLEMTISSTFASSDNDSCGVATDTMQIKPFCEAPGSSSDEVEFEELESNPFADSNIFKMADMEAKEACLQKRYAGKAAWASISKARKQKKTASVPILNKRHLIDFWKDFGNGEAFSLPTLGSGKSDSIQRISVDVARQVVEGMYNIDFQVIDCRFSYEFLGGHIQDAINISSIRELDVLLGRPRVLIFHCEFSSIRAPRLAQCLRNMDRMKNPYPLLTIPEIYVMEGGYKRFYNTHPELCCPKGYVTMDCANYRDLYKKEQYRLKTNKKP